MIRCDICKKGKLVRRTLRSFDATALVGIQLTAVGFSAFVCNACGEVFPAGDTINRLILWAARRIVTAEASLSASDARFLRKYLGLTQAELAERLGIKRVTVARWEGKPGSVLDGPSGIALRATVAGKLIAEGHLEGEALTTLRAPTRRPVKGSYRVSEKELRKVA